MCVQFYVFYQETQPELLGYFNEYKIADCKIIRNSGKRSLKLIENGERSSEVDAEIRLVTSTETFSLLLHEDDSFGDISIETHFFKGIPKKHGTRTMYYNGVLKDNSLRSFVTGYVHRNVFSGYIVNENNTYFVDPLIHFSPNDTFSQKVTIYQEENLNLTHWSTLSDSFSSFPLWKRLHGKANINMKRIIASENTDFGNQKDLFCEIEIVADHTLYIYFKRDIQKLKAYIYLHVKYADKIFRTTDFNMDGKPDGIRISIAKISVYETPYDDNYPMVEALNLEQYLMKLLYRKQTSPFCLSITMSYLPFKGPAIGQAFKPDLSMPNFFSGICEKPLLDYDDNETMLYFNVGVVNLRISNKTLLPLGITALAFTHEIGHGFGSDHDPMVPHMCSPSMSTGKYLMYPKTLQAPLQRSQFSPCSRIAIANIIRLKGGCLKTKNATCGNAIREGDEECDCGKKTTCHSIDPCCTPSDAEAPEIGCTLKNSSSECSPKENTCCKENCTVSNDTNLLCYSDSFLCLMSYCDGIHPECPEPVNDFSICPTKPLLCNGSICNSSVCWQLGLQECFCWEDKKSECLICCQQEGRCVPALTLGLFNSSEASSYVHEEGTACNYGVDKCDDMGNCISEKRRRGRFSRILLGLTLISFAAIVLLGITMYFLRNRMNLRHLFLLRNHI